MARTRASDRKRTEIDAVFDVTFFKFQLFRSESVFPGRILVATMTDVNNKNRVFINQFLTAQQNGRCQKLWSYRPIDPILVKDTLSRKITSWHAT